MHFEAHGLDINRLVTHKLKNMIHNANYNYFMSHKRYSPIFERD